MMMLNVMRKYPNSFVFILTLLMYIHPTNPITAQVKETPVPPFSQRLIEKMPPGMKMPEEIIRTLDWLEANGHGGLVKGTNGKKVQDHIISLYPFEDIDKPGASHAYFKWDDLSFTRGWDEPDTTVDEKVFLFTTTGGDGSRAGIWLDEKDKQWFVHVGSGSGSLWAGVISDDPLVFLRFLAIGYDEPAFDVHHDLTPAEAIYASHGISDAEEWEEVREESDDPDSEYPQPLPPTAFQKFLKQEFGVGPPDRASDIIPFPAPGLDDEGSSDPFNSWLNKVTPAASEEELARINEIIEMVEGIDLDDNKQGFLGWIRKKLGF